MRALLHRAAAALASWAAFARLRRLLAPLLLSRAASVARGAMLTWAEVAQQWRRLRCTAVVRGAVAERAAPPRVVHGRHPLRTALTSRALRTWREAGTLHRVVRAAVSRRAAYLTLPRPLGGADAFRLYREPFECRRALTAWHRDAGRRRVHRTRADEYALQCALGRLQACCGRVRVRVRAHPC